MYKQRRIYMSPEGDGGGGGGTPPAGSPPPAGGGGDLAALAANFKQALASEFQTHPAMADIKDLNGLAKSYISAQQMIGADKIVLPKQDAPPEEWNAIWRKLGAPETADGYDFSQVQLPGGLQVNKDMDAFAKSMFHKHGIPAEKAKGMYKEFMEKQYSDYQNTVNSRRQALDGLKQEWGSKYEVEEAVAKQAVFALGGEELKAWFNESGLGDDPMMIRIFNTVGKMMREDATFSSRMQGGGFSGSEDGARAEIAQLQTDKDFMTAYLNRDNPQHMAAKTRMDALWARAYPGKVQS